MGDTVALAHFARARGLLWGEANAIKFIEGVVKKEKVLLELVEVVTIEVAWLLDHFHFSKCTAKELYNNQLRID